MQKTTGPYRVFVGILPSGYLQPDVLEKTIYNGMLYCGSFSALETYSTVLMQSDVGYAENKIAAHAYTHPEIIRAACCQILKVSSKTTIRLLTRTTSEIPYKRILKRAHGFLDRYMFKGYFELEEYFKGKLRIFNYQSIPQTRYLLGLEKDSEWIAPSDLGKEYYRVFLPKLKLCPALGGITGALALGEPYLEICNPELIISDGIVTLTSGSSKTGLGFELGVVLISNNALAHDWVASEIFNLRPLDGLLLKKAAHQGWGPQSFSEIELGGAGHDGLKLLRGKTKAIPKPETHSLEFLSKNSSTEILNHTMLDWFYSVFSPHKKGKDFTFPISVGMGEFANYPTRLFIVAIGNSAIHSIKQLTSNRFGLMVPKIFRKIFGGPSGVYKVKLKNGSSHYLIEISETVTMRVTMKDLILIFQILSLGRIGRNCIRFSVFVDYLLSILKNTLDWFRPTKTHYPVALTMRLKQNVWWAVANEENFDF